jgi:hypothetical protein
MTHINQRLPLRVSDGTPSRIDTADGWSFGIEWKDNRNKDPYADAEQFAAFIVRAVNAHDDLVSALMMCRTYLSELAENDKYARDDMELVDNLLAKATP